MPITICMLDIQCNVADWVLSEFPIFSDDADHLREFSSFFGYFFYLRYFQIQMKPFKIMHCVVCMILNCEAG